MLVRSQIIFVVVVGLSFQTAVASDEKCIGHFPRWARSDSLKKLDAQIQGEPDNPDLYPMRAKVHAKNGNHELALADFSKAIELNRSNPYPYWVRAQYWSDQRETSNAISDLDQAIRLKPDDAAAHSMRGTLRAIKHQWEAADDDFATALELEPDNAQIQFEHAMYLIARHGRLAAVEGLNAVLQLEPEHVMAYSLRGWQFMLLGNFQQAIEDYTEAIKIDPRNASAYVHRAVARMQQREFGKALADLQHAADLDLRQVNPRDIRFVAQEALNAANRKLAQLSPDSTDPAREASIRRERGIANRALERWTEAQGDLDEAIRLDQSSSVAFSIRGRLWLRQQEWDRAIQDFSDSLRLNPRDATVWTDRGTAHFEKKDWTAACDDFTQALEIDSQQQHALACRGMARQALGQSELAFEDYEQVIIGKPFFEYPPVQQSLRTTEPSTGGDNRHPAQISAANGDDDSQFELPKVGLSLNASGNGEFITENSRNAGSAQRNTSLADGSQSQVTAQAKHTPAAVRLHPRYLKAYLNDAALAAQKKSLPGSTADYATVDADYKDLIKLVPSDPQGYRQLAWLRATCPADQYRNGDEAVQLAQTAAELGHSAEDYVALAAAYAEQGQFEVAANFQSKAQEVALESLNKSLLALKQTYRAAEFEKLVDEDAPKSDSDTQQKLEAALQACKQSEWKDSQAIEHYADACAAAGQYEQALECCELVHILKKQEREQPLQELLEQYQSGKPFRAVREQDQRLVDGPDSSSFVANVEPFTDSQEIGVSGLPPNKLTVAQIRLLSLEAKPNENRAANTNAVAENESSSEELRQSADHVIQKQALARVSRLIRQGLDCQKRGEFENALSKFQEAIEIDCKNADAIDHLAWLLATCPDDRLRNGQEALKQALVACELTGKRTWNHLFTLAAAYAETGNFKSAIEWTETAIELIPFDEPDSETERLKASLEKFHSSQPLRDE